MQPTEYNFVGAFNISQVEGVIRTVSQLDREQVEMIRLGLVCEDLQAATGRQTATATLTVMVIDINDNDPQFRRPHYRRSVAENAKKGTTIATVVADDVDRNRTITYSLQVGIMLLHFQIKNKDNELCAFCEEFLFHREIFVSKYLVSVPVPDHL